MAEENNIPPRQELDFSLTTVEDGKVSVKMLDRINVDDVVTQLMLQEVFRVVAKTDIDPTVNPLFKDFLLKEGFTAGQN
jgi:hypothetical protein